MSIETEPVPPLPQHTPPIDKRTGALERFENNWMQWFVAVRNKINVINSLIVAISKLTGSGFVAISGGSAITRTLQGPNSVKITNGDGISGDPVFQLENDSNALDALTAYGKDSTGTRGWFRPALFESTGLLSGCALSIFSTTQVRISAGILGFADYSANPAQPVRSVLQFAQTDVTITAIGSQPVTYIGINSAGTVIQQDVPFTNTQRRTIVSIGVAVHTNLTSINAVNNLPSIVQAGIAQLTDYLIYSGRIHKGIEYAANGANLNINRSAGSIFIFGGNFQTNPLDPSVVSISGQTALTFRYRTQDGEPAGDVTSVQHSSYDNAGTITAVPSNDWTVQRIFIFPSGLTRIQYGQATYANLSEAIAGWQTEVFVTEQNIADNGTPVGLIFVKEGATALNDPAEAKFQPLTASGRPASPSVPLANTDSLSEGTTNLYYTDVRAQAAVKWTTGTGSPEGVVTASVGTLYSRSDGGASTTLYVKESGAGNTGWVAK